MMIELGGEKRDKAVKYMLSVLSARINPEIRRIMKKTKMKPNKLRYQMTHPYKDAYSIVVEIIRPTPRDNNKHQNVSKWCVPEVEANLIRVLTKALSTKRTRVVVGKPKPGNILAFTVSPRYLEDVHSGIEATEKVLKNIPAVETAVLHYTKGQRIVVNYGTTKAPEYYVATVKTRRHSGYIEVVFDDGQKKDYKPTTSKVGIVGVANGRNRNRRRKSEIPKKELKNWIITEQQTNTMLLMAEEVVNKGLKAFQKKYPREKNLEEILAIAKALGWVEQGMGKKEKKKLIGYILTAPNILAQHLEYFSQKLTKIDDERVTSVALYYKRKQK